MKLFPYLGLVGMAVSLAGCGSATNNGLLPSGPVMPPLPQPVSQPTPAPAAPIVPKEKLPQLPRTSSTSIREESLPTQALPSPASPPATVIPEAKVTPMVKEATGITSGSFAQTWTQDLASARQQSTSCIGESGAQRVSCWQGVSSWAQARATSYGSAAKILPGAQAEQAGAAQKFFQTTSQWASACSSLSAADCAKSPLIAKMQQWKSSVGISAGGGK
ncbi:hypothetical protein [Acidithiobacillus sp. AMEEHan]|uniref:hypothetical protein n=1 Tax=Acidithiobacillus sp. AMEEHan TaxID=2994951 RepID=UPI0027E56C9B|nr:hypothetical protein [Acidithiobacillus sp. AMEEHan]